MAKSMDCLEVSLRYCLLDDGKTWAWTAYRISTVAYPDGKPASYADRVDLSIPADVQAWLNTQLATAKTENAVA